MDKPEGADPGRCDKCSQFRDCLAFYPDAFSPVILEDWADHIKYWHQHERARET